MKQKKFIIIFCIIASLLIPFNIDNISISGSDIKLYKAGLYTVARINVLGLTKTKVYFFPSNIDANNNFKVMTDKLGDIGDSLNGLFNY